MTKSQESGKEKASVQFTLEGEAAKQLIASADASGRSYRREALIRLTDHLFSFSSVAEIGQAVKRN
ncbi:TraY domain-containing protein [Vibrio vulnificus]|uniref:TraY domain-containing protein n=1 Tax=Vibrio vulnificus TaxID=672 RepID=UPI0040596DC0